MHGWANTSTATEIQLQDSQATNVHDTLITYFLALSQGKKEESKGKK